MNMCGGGGVAKAQSDKLDEGIADDYKKSKNEIKLLLLGTKINI